MENKNKKQKKTAKVFKLNYSDKKVSNATKKDNKGESSFNVTKTKRLRGILIVVYLVLVALIIRLGFLQFVDGDRLKEMAYKQQTTNQIISTKRGTIYDATGKALAISASVDTITINPSKISVSDDDEEIAQLKTKALKEKVAQAFSDIFELDYQEVLDKVNSNNNIETIAKKVETEKVDELEKWMKENEIYSGINIDEDTKRYYPYNNLASNLIGFCGTDNQGLEGIEAWWDSVLTGTPGKITTSTDAVQDFIPDKDETYIAAENGSNITLTIDLNIQTIIEKYLKQAVIENDCNRGGSVIVMEPSTGNVLGMATYPDYDLNTPFEPTEELQDGWDNLSSTEKSDALAKVWRNICVSNTYEPGSTYKIITAAAGLEENLVETDTKDDFMCTGYEMFPGNVKIGCWKTSSHGSQTLREALENSCNPALMQLGKRIGASTLYKYYEAFGLFEKTGIETSGETKGIFFDLDKVGPVELATMSFGQRITVTPIQLITAISAVANNGVLMQPRIVSKIENADTGAVTVIEPKEVRQVISKETAIQLCDMLESVVTDGTGKYGQVAGYSIAGKTGTSEPSPGKEDEGYVASYVAFSPAENAQVAILVTLYDPRGSSHQGGSVAGPVVSQMLSEILPYLDIPTDGTQQDATNNTSTDSQAKTLMDVRNKTVAEAKKILEEAGFTCSTTADSTSLVSDQVPKPGTSLLTGSIIKLYETGNDARVSTTVPNLKGMSLAQAKNALKSKGLNLHYTGSGTVLSQDPIADSSVEEGSVVNVILQQEIQDAH